MAKIANVFQKEEVKKAVHPKRITKWIHYTKLVRNEKQYCDAKDKEEIEGLADVIEADGMVLQDLLVKKTDTDEYKIIAGHKRHAACKLLVEERGRKEFEFLPCFEQNLSDVRTEFQVYSSNFHHTETPYEIMHKLERMQFLLNEYPEEFPELQGGRMVERLARKYNLSKSTVGEYLTISKNLGEKAMKEFKNGTIDKSAAVTLASMPEEKQEQALKSGFKTNKQLKEYKKEGLELDEEELLRIYDTLKIEKFYEKEDEKLCRKLVDNHGNAYSCFTLQNPNMEIGCTPTEIIIKKSNTKKIFTWEKFVELLRKKVPERKLKKNWDMYVERSGNHYTANLQVTPEVYARLDRGQQKSVLIEGEWDRKICELRIWTTGRPAYDDSMTFGVGYVATSETDVGIKEGYSLLNLVLSELPF